MPNHCVIKLRLSSGWTGAMIGIAVFLTSGALLAQTRVSLNGKVTSLKEQELMAV